jgi:hypothetical protein
MTLWTFGDQATPGTHALVVGVGRYPALVGGSAPLYDKHGGMGQLTSAPVSALAFASWLVDPAGYRSAAAPLRSLELLVSVEPPASFAPPGEAPVEVGAATFESFRKAVLAWFARGGASPKSRTIFYFCGHGILGGLNTSLLLEDFGLVPPAALDSALDFTRFHKGMDQCLAREQLYLIDACRVASSVVLHSAENYGVPIIQADKPTHPRRKPPAVYSALPGAAAYGRAGETSFFTDALLRAMKGSGAGRDGKAWRILPSVLHRAVNRLLGDAIAGTGADQACSIEPLVDFALHDLDEPVVPVKVSVQPPLAASNDVLRATRGGVDLSQGPPIPPLWSLELPPGEYRFTAGAPFKDELVYPPFTEVELP